MISIHAEDTGLNTGSNDNSSATVTFSISLTPTNDAPVFTPGLNISVAEDSGVYNNAWATNTRPAGGLLSNPQTAVDESSQLVDFVLTTDKPQLFAVPPSINTAGVLNFTPQQNAFGTALVTVVARDRGPSGVNDQNSSAPYTLTITIDPRNDDPVAQTDSYTTSENVVLNVAAPGILANDTDVDLPNDQ